MIIVKSFTVMKLLIVACLALAVLSVDAASKRTHHADTTITHKVFFDVEIDGHKAGGLHLLCRSRWGSIM